MKRIHFTVDIPEFGHARAHTFNVSTRNFQRGPHKKRSWIFTKLIEKTHPLVEIRVNLIRVFVEKGNLLSSIFENLKSNINHMHLDNHLTQNSLKMFHMVVIENDSVKPSCDIANSAKHHPCLGLPRPVHVVTAFAVNSLCVVGCRGT